MATTSDLAPSRPAPKRPTGTRSNTKPREEQLEDQVAQLQSDLKAIAATLAKLSNEKVSEVRDVAKSEMRHLQRQGQHVIDDVQDQAGAVEKQCRRSHGSHAAHPGRVCAGGSRTGRGTARR